jgi:hypothetical protein
MLGMLDDEVRGVPAYEIFRYLPFDRKASGFLRLMFG